MEMKTQIYGLPLLNANPLASVQSHICKDQPANLVDMIDALYLRCLQRI